MTSPYTTPPYPVNLGPKKYQKTSLLLVLLSSLSFHPKPAPFPGPHLANDATIHPLIGDKPQPSPNSPWFLPCPSPHLMSIKPYHSFLLNNSECSLLSTSEPHPGLASSVQSELLKKYLTGFPSFQPLPNSTHSPESLLESTFTPLCKSILDHL